jgi:hypothetical protein
MMWAFAFLSPKDGDNGCAVTFDCKGFKQLEVSAEVQFPRTWLRPFPNVAWLDVPLNRIFPALLFIGAGIASFPLVRKLKEPIQQKVLIGAALLSILCGVPFLIPQFSQNMSSLF